MKYLRLLRREPPGLVMYVTKNTTYDSTTTCASCTRRKPSKSFLEEILNEFETEYGLKCEHKREPKRRGNELKKYFRRQLQFARADKVGTSSVIKLGIT
jgi:hypothetical protein